MLETLMELEKENEERMRESAEEINRELGAIQRARLASRAYYGSRLGPEEARFVDRKR